MFSGTTGTNIVQTPAWYEVGGGGFHFGDDSLERIQVGNIRNGGGINLFDTSNPTFSVQFEVESTLTGDGTLVIRDQGTSTEYVATETYVDNLIPSYANPTGLPETFQIACSDLTTALTTGASKAYFRAPNAFTVTEVRASLLTAQPSGSIFTVNIKENGTTILSTKITIDNTTTTSVGASTPPVISDSSIADDSIITIDIDQVGTSGATGLIVTLIGHY